MEITGDVPVENAGALADFRGLQALLSVETTMTELEHVVRLKIVTTIPTEPVLLGSVYATPGMDGTQHT